MQQHLVSIEDLIESSLQFWFFKRKKNLICRHGRVRSVITIKLIIICHFFSFQEIELFTSSLNQLKLAQQKFLESQECLNKVSPENNCKDILVPLTSSVSLF